MKIQWFPGHMTKALRMMDKEIKVVDVIVYVIDSRAPFSCVNPELNKMIGNKPIVYVLSKADLVEEKDLRKWVRYFTSDNTMAIALNSTNSSSGKQIISMIKKLLAAKIENNKRKNISLPLRAMVIGVPNSGKSTLINNICGKARTLAGNKPGVTKGKQWVSIESGFEFLDTPGTLWPSFENEQVALNLAYIGSIKDDVMDINELSYSLIETIRKINPKVLKERYGIDFDDDEENIEIFDKICTARKCLLKGNEPDYDRCAKIIIDDFRKGKMGKIILD